MEKTFNTSLHFIMAIIEEMLPAAAAAHMSNERVITWSAFDIKCAARMHASYR